MALQDVKNAVFNRLGLKGASRDKEATYWAIASASPVIIAQTGASLGVTGTTAETTLATITIPGGMVGVNGAIRVTATYRFTNTVNTKTVLVRFAGVSLDGFNGANAASSQTQTVIRNRNSTTQQRTYQGGFGFGNAGGTIVGSSIDTTVDQVLTLTCTLADGTDVATLEGYTVEILPSLT